MTMRAVLATAASIACLAWTAVTCEAQEIAPDRSRYQENFYTAAPYPKQVTVSDKTGRVLSVLEIPSDVAVSLHLAEGDSNRKDLPSGVTYTGRVSVRTRPRSELVQGSLFEQIMTAPFRLDLQDVVVVLAAKR